MDRINRIVNNKIKNEFTNIELNKFVLNEIYNNLFLKRSEISEKILNLKLTF